MAQQSNAEAVDAYLALTPVEQRQVDFASQRLRESLQPPLSTAMPSQEEYLQDYGTPEELQAFYDASEAAYERTRMTLG